jgi:hypothetical protein
MNIAAAQIGAAVEVAVQKQMLDHVSAQGAALVSLIASAPTPSGSVNLPHQGQNLDVRA